MTLKKFLKGSIWKKIEDKKKELKEIEEEYNFSPIFEQINE